MLANPEIRTTFRRWGIVILLLVVIAVLVFSIILGGDSTSSFASSEVVPISINSNLIANYQPDVFSGEVAAIAFGIIGEAILDQQPDNGNAGDKIDDFENDLRTPVPTVTPMPTMTPTDLNAQTGTVQASSTPAASSTEPSPEATNTLLASATGTIQASNTPNIDATATSTTNATATRTVVASQSPTSSPGPTLPPTPVPSSTFAPTFTPRPPSTPSNTPTQTADSCGMVKLSDFTVKKDEVSWTITNNGGQKILLTGTYINWPSENVELSKVKLEKRIIWDQKDKTPPTYISLSWKGRESAREIAAGKSRVILFEFDQKAAALGYFLELTFDYSCIITSTN